MSNRILAIIILTLIIPASAFYFIFNTFNHEVIEECGPKPGAPGNWVCENGKWVNKEGRLQPLLNNTGFEETIPDEGDSGRTFDPAAWGVCEGKTEKGTCNVIVEWPTLIQVVSNENGVSPYAGEKMLKIDARLYVKTNVRQYYAQRIDKED